MNKKLLASLAAAGVLAGGTTAAVLAATGGIAGAAAAPSAAASTPPSMPCTGDALRSLVSKGTITQAQATAFQDALWAYMRGGHDGSIGSHMRDIRDHRAGMPMWLPDGGPMRTVLQQLVSKGTITQAQASAITNAITLEMRDHWGNGYGMHWTYTWHGHGTGMMDGRHMGMG